MTIKRLSLLPLLLSFCLLFSGCDELAKMGVPLTEADVANGLKEALIQGVNRGSGSLFSTQTNGNTALLNELLPSEVQEGLKLARTLGMGSKVDAISNKLNQAAVNTVKQSIPIFTNSIRQMSITDAWNILRGDRNAATQFLRRTTTNALVAAIKPEVNSVFASVGLKPTLLANLGVNNAMLGGLDVDMTGLLANLITTKMYSKIEEEESRIRTDISARTTGLMQRVFAAAVPATR